MSAALHHLKDLHLPQTKLLFQEFPEIFSQEDQKMWREALLKVLLHELPHTQVFVCVDAGSVVGAIMFHEDQQSQNHYWEIDWLVVRSSSQGQGLGKLLVDKALDVIKDKEGTHVYLHKSTAHHNEHTKAFYAKMKFRELAVFPDYYLSSKKNANENSILFYRQLA